VFRRWFVHAEPYGKRAGWFAKSWYCGSLSLAAFANALVFLLIGVGVYGVALWIVANSLPGNLWRQAVEEKQLGAAIVLAGIALGLGWIVAAAVH
jgi:putative membrane protein